MKYPLPDYSLHGNITDLYIDLEWNRKQKIFLFGYAYSIKTFIPLYGYKLNIKYIKEMLAPVTGNIYFYGPDIAMTEKNFDISIRKKYTCINLLTAFKRIDPSFTSYRLCELEKYYDIPRSVKKYKNNIWTIYSDWFKPEFRKMIIQYNKEDVLNLIRIKKTILNQNNITRSKLLAIMKDTIKKI